jgi:DNA-binding NarL/FixJ family response regulator
MIKPKIQIDDVIRVMTDEEYQIYLADQANEEIKQAERDAKIMARQSALAKLAALGLTEDEIATL